MFLRRHRAIIDCAEGEIRFGVGNRQKMTIDDGNGLKAVSVRRVHLAPRSARIVIWTLNLVILPKGNCSFSSIQQRWVIREIVCFEPVRKY